MLLAQKIQEAVDTASKTISHILEEKKSHKKTEKEPEIKSSEGTFLIFYTYLLFAFLSQRKIRICVNQICTNESR